MKKAWDRVRFLWSTDVPPWQQERLERIEALIHERTQETHEEEEWWRGYVGRRR